MSVAASNYSTAGFDIVAGVVDRNAIADLVALVDPLLVDHAERGGVRGVLGRLPDLVPVVVGPLRNLAVPILGDGAFGVRVLLFDKTPLANWKATWHQDVTVGVTEYREVAGWGPWSRKEGTWNVRPPAAVLDRMVTVRLHLDDCGPRNGPVRVAPGTHTRGRMSDPQVDAAIRGVVPIDCIVPAGGILRMSPLLLHASAPAADPSHRRVIHAEFAADPLPDGFEWAERWAPS
jgi:hypothetical protein